MTMKSKVELKEVFSGLASILIKKGGITDFATVEADFDLPVEVDSLSMSQGAPTLNHYKVHGLQSDWAVTSTPGEFEFSAFVPSVHEDLINYFLGEANVVAASKINGKGYKGISATLKDVKLNVGMVLLSEDESHAFVVKNMTVYATPTLDSPTTKPLGFTLTGSIVLDDAAATGASDDNIAFLTRDTTQDAGAGV